MVGEFLLRASDVIREIREVRREIRELRQEVLNTRAIAERIDRRLDFLTTVREKRPMIIRRIVSGGVQAQLAPEPPEIPTAPTRPGWE